MVFEKKLVVRLMNVTSMDRTVHVRLVVMITCSRITIVKKNAIIKYANGIKASATRPLSKIQFTSTFWAILSKMTLREKDP